ADQLGREPIDLRAELPVSLLDGVEREPALDLLARVRVAEHQLLQADEAIEVGRAVHAHLPLGHGLLEAADIVVHNLDDVLGAERARLSTSLDHFLLISRLLALARFFPSSQALGARRVLPEARLRAAVASGELGVRRERDALASGGLVLHLLAEDEQPIYLGPGHDGRVGAARAAPRAARLPGARAL